MAEIRGILSTDPQYKVWEQAFKEANKKKEEKRSVQPVKKEARALTMSEKRKVNTILDKYNKEIIKRFGLQNVPEGYEIR